jgi:hypothetical protein
VRCPKCGEPPRRIRLWAEVEMSFDPGRGLAKQQVFGTKDWDMATVRYVCGGGHVFEPTKKETP